MKIFFSVGEVSGDSIGALLIRELLSQPDPPEVYGLGGPRMANAGARIILSESLFGVVGITEAISAMPRGAVVLARVCRFLRKLRPDVVVLISNEAFNIPLGLWCRRRGIYTICLFPPQIWMWEKVALYLARSFDLILASFPDEYHVYDRSGTKTLFVGHYLCELLPPLTKALREEARSHLGLQASDFVISLMPGSRSGEVAAFTPCLLDSAAALRRRDNRLFFLLPVADEALRPQLVGDLTSSKVSDYVRLVDDGHAALRASDFALMASGTATLEATLLGIPLVAFYRVSPLTFAGVRVLQRVRLLDSNRFALPNLILGREVVPELLQNDGNSENLVEKTISLIDDPIRIEQMKGELENVRRMIARPHSIQRIVTAIQRDGSPAG